MRRTLCSEAPCVSAGTLRLSLAFQPHCHHCSLVPSWEWNSTAPLLWKCGLGWEPGAHQRKPYLPPGGRGVLSWEEAAWHRGACLAAWDEWDGPQRGRLCLKTLSWLEARLVLESSSPAPGMAFFLQRGLNPNNFCHCHTCFKTLIPKARDWKISSSSKPLSTQEAS